MMTAADKAAAKDNLFNLAIPLTAAFGSVIGLLGGQAAGLGPWVGLIGGAVLGAVMCFVLARYVPKRAGRWGSAGLIGVIGLLMGGISGLIAGAICGALLSWFAYWIHHDTYRKGVPAYATSGQVLWHNAFLFICGFIFFFLIAPIVTIIPLSFNAENFFTFTPGMLALEADAFSLKHYRDFFTNEAWIRPLKNSLIIAPFATIISVSLGTLAAIGLSQSHVPFRRGIMAILISPMIVPLIISATGMFFFTASWVCGWKPILASAGPLRAILRSSWRMPHWAFPS